MAEGLPPPRVPAPFPTPSALYVNEAVPVRMQRNVAKTAPAVPASQFNFLARSGKKLNFWPWACGHKIVASHAPYHANAADKDCKQFWETL